MSAAAIPYIRFEGNTREALNFYQSVFGGVVEVMTFGDMHVPDVPADAVMHGALTADGFSVYGYDAMPGEDLGDRARIRIALVGADLKGLTASFDALTDGGQVVTPLAAQMWGDTYGEVIDRYGVAWMFNIHPA